MDRPVDDPQQTAQASRRGGPLSPMDSAVIAFCLLALTMLVLFHDAAFSMVRVWLGSRTYNHGFFIPLIVGYLVWLRRDRLRVAEPRPSLLGIVWLAGAGVLLLVGTLAQAAVLQQFAFVGMLQGAVLTVFGTAIVRLLCFPLFYMLFMVPVGDFAIAPLQDLTARYTTVLVRASGVPIHLENWVLVIPGGSFLVAEACAGVRFLIATVAVGVLMAGLFFERWWKRILFVALSVLVPIGANVVRAYGIVMLAHWSNFEIAVGVDHIVYGFLFLAIVLLILIGLGHAMRDMPAMPEPPMSAETVVAGGGGISLHRMAGFTLAVLLLLIGVAAYADLLVRPGPPVSITLRAPAASGEWQRLERAESDDWSARFDGADAQGHWHYDNGVSELSLYIGYYAEEYPGKEMIAHGNTIAADIRQDLLERGRLQDWEIRAIPPPLYAVALLARGPRVVWYWYVVGDRVTSSPAEAKFLAARGRLLSGGASAGVIAISATGSPRETQTLVRFLRGSELEEILSSGSLDRLVVPRDN